MRPTTFVLLITTLMVAAPPAHADTGDCTTAREKLEAFISPLGDGCTEDSQCEAAYIRAHSCEGPAVIRTGSLTKDIEPDLITLQAAVRAACYGPATPTMPACEAIPARPACQQGHCVDLLNRLR